MYIAANSLMTHAFQIIACSSDRASAAEQVDKVQRAFILRMLSFSTFSKHLAAVRETNELLKRSMESQVDDEGHSLQVNVRWLQEHGIVKELLRANLHQKQYVDQVQNVLKKLTVRGSLQQEHLEMLWNLTEKVDTFEAVKNNVYSMLGDLAGSLSEEQLNLMFEKFQSRSEWPLADCLKLLDLVAQLADSDQQCKQKVDDDESAPAALHLLKALLPHPKDSGDLQDMLVPTVDVIVARMEEICAQPLLLPGTPSGAQSMLKDNLLQYADFLLWASTKGDFLLTTDLAVRLWKCLVMQGTSCQDQGYRFFAQGLLRFEPDAIEQLLLEMESTLDAQTLGLHGWTCFLAYFTRVNLQRDMMITDTDDSPRFAVRGQVLVGKEFIWKLVLTCENMTLYEEARNYLFRLYTYVVDERCLQDYVLQLVRECLDRMRQAIDLVQLMSSLPMLPPEQEMELLASRQALARTLDLLLVSSNQLPVRTMPERPMHSASTEGQQISITVLPWMSGTERFSLSVDTNSYISVVRQQIAAKCGYSGDPASLRLLFMGRELANDARTLAMEDVKGGMTMQMALKSQLKLDEDAARPPLQTVPVLLAEQAGSYELLLELADAFPQDATIRDITSQLLNLMPTFPDITQRLAEALLGGQNASALSELWTEAGQDDEAASVKAAHLKYTIE
ncbi:hypothetical protein WJX84_008107, partial [Apatococcus fuscideae]